MQTVAVVLHAVLAELFTVVGGKNNHRLVEPDVFVYRAQYLADKVVGLRVFEDAEGRMNRSLHETGGSMLVVSQFTLWGDCRKGRRPSFVAAADPEVAEQLYETFVSEAQSKGIRVQCGRFRQLMQVELVNDGPVTILLDSQKSF